MNIRACLSLCLILSFTACGVGGGTAKTRIDKYFDLVNLLDEQTELLYSNGTILKKKLTANGEVESLMVQADSAAQFKYELKLFYEADINKLGLGDSYFTEELPGINGTRKVINTAKGSGPKVRLIEYDYESDKLRQIRILMEDKNDVYSFEKEMLMNFESINGRETLRDYRIQGKQQMVMKSDLDFIIEGRFSR
jgi:hypothetical protein